VSPNKTFFFISSLSQVFVRVTENLPKYISAVQKKGCSEILL
jgi:hypothetical protein